MLGENGVKFMMSKLKAGQRIEAGQATWLIRLLWANLGISAVVTLLTLIVGEPEELTTAVRLLLLMARFLIVISVATAILWLVWGYRTYANLLEVGCRRISSSPAASVYWWFVPFANLLMPFRITKEIWYRSELSNEFAEVSGDNLPPLQLWWAMFLISHFVSNMVYRSTKYNLALEFVSGVLDVASAYTAIQLVMGIHSHQQAMHNPAREKIETL
jgi:hypothetical protein